MSIVSLNARAPWCDRTAAFAPPVTEHADTTGVQHVHKAHALRTTRPFGLADVHSNQYVFRSPQCTQAQGPALAIPAPREIRMHSPIHAAVTWTGRLHRNSLRPEYLQGPDGPADPELADGTPREREPGCRFPGSGSQAHECRTLNTEHWTQTQGLSLSNLGDINIIMAIRQ